MQHERERPHLSLSPLSRTSSSVSSTMQSSSSYYAAPRCESQIWTDWLRSERVANSSSWSSSTASTLVDDSILSDLKTVTDESLLPCYLFTPATPDSPFESSSSQLSISTASDYDELPEIPFISSASIRHQNGWSPAIGHIRDRSDDSNCERSFWASVIRPSTSQSSDGSMPILGQMNERILAPKRQRAPSISSTATASSRSRPAPAKSILSSSSSIRTKTGRATPSVKFLDMPTIHYEEDYDPEPHRAPAVPTEKRKPGLLRWFLGSVSSKKSQSVSDRPTISGPFPLWETPPPRRVPGGAASLRSMKSKDSLRSVRSCSSRLQTYWSRVTRQDP